MIGWSWIGIEDMDFSVAKWIGGCCLAVWESVAGFFGFLGLEGSNVEGSFCVDFNVDPMDLDLEVDLDLGLHEVDFGVGKVVGISGELA